MTQRPRRGNRALTLDRWNRFQDNAIRFRVKVRERAEKPVIATAATRE